MLTPCRNYHDEIKIKINDNRKMITLGGNY